MSAHEDKINEFLKSMAFSVRLDPIEGIDFSFKVTEVTHAGTSVTIALQEDTFIFFQHFCCFVPKVNIVLLFRRLLSLNAEMGGVYFFIDETQNLIGLRACRHVEGLDFVEFKAALDDLVSRCWQYLPDLVQEFQLPMEAA